jgi:hypothetical protein
VLQQGTAFERLYTYVIIFCGKTRAYLMEILYYSGGNHVMQDCQPAGVLKPNPFLNNTLIVKGFYVQETCM